MSLRISRIKAGLTSAISRSGAMNGDDPVSINTRILPVPPVTALSRRQTYQKMRVGLTTAELRLKNAGRAIAGTTRTRPSAVRSSERQTQDDNSSAQFDANANVLALAGLTADSVKPRTGKPIHTRKNVLQLRMQNVRKLRKPATALGRAGLDHDALPGSDDLLHASDLTSDSTPAVHGPFDPALPLSRTDTTRPYLLPQTAEAARRKQVEKLFQN
jgi:uncharacterized protein (DUF2342 family)